MKQRLVLIGNGMAGVRTLEELLKLAPETYDITVFGAEPYGNYNRILLSPVLAGEKTIDEIMLNDEQWYVDNGITLHKGKQVVDIDRGRKIVRAADGTEARYDRLILATGSNPFIIPIPGKDLPGVVSFRDIYDVDRMLAAAEGKGHAVVIGGGLLGLEAANGLLRQGMHVTVVHLLDTLMERQLDKAAAGLLKRSLEERGLNFLMQAQTEAILGKDEVAGRALQGWSGDTGRSGGDGGRHPSQFRTGQEGRPALRARRGRQRQHADLRSAHLRRRRMRAASRHQPTVWSRRCSSRPRSAPIIWPNWAMRATPAR